MVTSMGINGMCSVMGSNLRLMESRLGMEEYNVCKVWEQKCKNESDAGRLCVQIRELCAWRDSREWAFLEKGENKSIIDCLCTNWILIICILLF